ncbi:hypothetical protein D7X88_15370 [bacterium C-53]|nr:hypothetical protein [Lachnospiraceae bacterium]NBI04345.1 hypothetical protein [Lachnospiraceae bacterium]RKJ08345.1 hypothetical protein D7X88_15370 [bacterium C-53]
MCKIRKKRLAVLLAISILGTSVPMIGEPVLAEETVEITDVEESAVLGEQQENLMSGNQTDEQDSVSDNQTEAPEMPEREPGVPEAAPGISDNELEIPDNEPAVSENETEEPEEETNPPGEDVQIPEGGPSVSEEDSVVSENEVQEEEISEMEEIVVGVSSRAITGETVVRSNDGKNNPGAVQLGTFEVKDETAKTAVFLKGYGSPTIHVPTYILVTGLNGDQAVEFEKELSSVEDPDLLNRIYTVTDIDPECFKTEVTVQNIELPNTITSDITYDFFEKCRQLSTINIYFWGDTNHKVLKYGRYYDGGQEIYGNKQEYATGVLIDREKDASGNVTKQTVVCCPKNTSLTSFRFSDESSATETSEVVIGPYAFKNCVGLRLISSGRPDSNARRVTEIGEGAFEGCSNLTNAYVFDTALRSVSDNAFKDCKALTQIEFAAGHDGELIFSLGKKVFENTRIASLDLPYYVSDVTAESFYGMGELSQITVDVDNAIYMAQDNVLYTKDGDERGKKLIVCPSAREMENGEFKIPYGVEEFDTYAFYNCQNLNSLVFPSNIVNLEKDVVKDCKYLNSVYIYSGFYQLTPGTGGVFDDIFDGCGYSKQTVTIYTGRDTQAWKFAIAFNYAKKALYDPADFEIEEKNGNLTIISYEDSAEFRDLVIPAWLVADDGTYKPVTGIAKGVLAKPGMTSVMFLANMKDVDAEAFRIIDPEYEDDVTKDICADSLKNIYIEEGNEYLKSENGALYKIKDGKISGLIYYPVGRTEEEYHAPEELEFIPMGVFRGASNLKKVYIYDNIQGIGSEHFGDYKESAAFAGCSNLVAIEIVPSQDTERLKFYGSDQGVLYAREGKESSRFTTLLYYPKGERRPADVTYSAMSYRVVSGCTRIKDMKNCVYLKRIVIPSSVTQIDDNAFEGSAELKTVEFLGSGIQTIGDEAFANTKIEALTLPASIEEIGTQAFYRCRYLKSVQITGNSLKSIGRDAFNGDRNIKTISIVSEGKEPSGDAVIAERAFAYLTSLESLEIKNLKTVNIGLQAFYYDSSLTTAVFDNSNVRAIGEGAFRGCSSLEEIDFTDSGSLQVISPEAFKGCSALENVLLPIKVSLIGKSAFEDCIILGEFNFGDLKVLGSIGESAFRNTGFSVVRLPEILVTLGGNAFGDCNMLTAVYVPGTVDIASTDMNPFGGIGEQLTLYGPADTKMHAYARSKSIRYVTGDIPNILINLSQTEVSLYDVGVTTVQLLATTQPENEEIVWRSSNPAVAYIADPHNGFVRAGSSGKAKVYAICTASGSRAVCDVTVIKTEVVIPEDSIILNLKEKMEIHATSVPLRQITYSTSNKKIAAVNKKGVVTAKKAGPAVITATAGEGDTLRSDTVNITVVKPTISLDKKRITLNEKGDGALLSDTLLVSHFGAHEEVKWISSNPRIVSVDGDNESATVTAHRAGNVKITAICNGKKARCRVRVKPVYTRLNKSVATLYVGGTKFETLKLKAKVSGMSKEVEWTSDRPEFAFVDEKGLVTAQSRGTATITASANGIAAQCKVKVMDSTVTILDKEGADLNPAIIVLNSAGNNKGRLNARVVGRSKKVKWSSLAKDVVTINNKGQLTGRNAGEAEVVAAANGVESYCTVRVLDTMTELDFDNITLSVSGNNGDPKMRTLTVTIEGADLRKIVKWESSNPAVAEITTAETVARRSQNTSEFGGIATANITALKPGKTVISATANGVTAKCVVEVLNE